MKIALVTGGKRGIGLAISEKLAQNDYYVVMTGVSDDSCGIIEKFQSKNLHADYFKSDISCSADRKSLLKYIDDKFGKLDLLVNNAGIACKERKDILLTSEESFDELIKVNLKGTFMMCQIFANYMISRKHKDDFCRIVNISSVSAYTSSVSRAEYCISKAGVSMVTKLFADRLAQYNIPVFEVRAGIIKTDMTACVMDNYKKLIDEGLTPVNRPGEPDDVANAVLAAASGYLDFGTGTVLNADGGFSIRRL